MTHGSLFSGIGGFDYAAELMGWENKFHCEKETFCKRVLNYYWPNAISYDDIKTTDFTIHRGTIDVLTGGFPCQPYSVAGKRKGKNDERHLWPEMCRAIREIQPRWVVGENVRGLISWNGGLVFDEVQADLEAAGYEVIPFVLPAAGVNAPHRRDRIWFVAHAGLQRQEKPEQQTVGNKQLCKSGNAAYSCSDGYEPRGFEENQRSESESQRERDKREWLRSNAMRNGSTELTSNSNGSKRPEGRMHQKGPKKAKRHSGSCNAPGNKRNPWKDFPTQSPVCIGNDGFPTELLRQRIREDCMGVISEKEIDKIISKALTSHRNESIKALGNAIVPQVELQIFRAIEQYELIK